MLKAELHVHSTYSDGRDRVERIVDVALERGLNVIAITDHDTIQGSLSAIDYVRDEHLEIEAIPALEISTSNGHLLAFFLEDEVESGMSLIETVDAVKKKGGISIISHPFQIERRGVFKPSLFSYADGIEVFNAKYIFGISNLLAERMAKRLGKAGIAGSDAHSANEVGYGITTFHGDLRRAIEEGKTGIMPKKIPLKTQFSYFFKRRF